MFANQQKDELAKWSLVWRRTKQFRKLLDEIFSHCLQFYYVVCCLGNWEDLWPIVFDKLGLEGLLEVHTCLHCWTTVYKQLRAISQLRPHDSYLIIQPGMTHVFVSAWYRRRSLFNDSLKSPLIPPVVVIRPQDYLSYPLK